MKTRINLIAVICIVMQVLSSCTDDYNDILPSSSTESIVLSPDEYISIANDNPSTITVQEAIKMVQDFSNQHSTRSFSTPTVVKENVLSDTVRVHGKDKLITMPTYEMSLGSNGGYAIVSADKRAPEIIVYSTTGKMGDVSENYGAKKMQQMSKKVALSKIAHIEFIKDSLRQKTLTKIANQLGVKKIDFNSVKDRIFLTDSLDSNTRSSLQHPNDKQAWKMVKSMIWTQWEQCYPYNKQLGKAAKPIHSSNKGFNAVGCAGVATAQVMAYYGNYLLTLNGGLFNWFPLFRDPVIDENSESDAIEAVSSLMRIVANGIKTEWDKNGDAGTSNIRKVYDYLNSIGLTFDIRKGTNGYAMSATRILTSLDQGYPVFVTGNDTYTGDGHLWILDGYMMIRRQNLISPSRMQIMTNDTYIHANFGWGGYCDGYYLVDEGTTNLSFQNDCDYSTGMMLFPNIRVK